MALENQNKYHTPLDVQLQQLALSDWPAFVNIIGEDAIVAAKVCILKSNGKTQAQISHKLHLTKRMAQYRAEKCKC